MSITENEIMGGVGFGDDTSFYDHSVDFSDLVMRKPLKDQLLENEEISYIKHNPTIDTYAPDDLDNRDTVQKYLLNRIGTSLPPASRPNMAKFNSELASAGLSSKLSKPITEKFGGAVSSCADFVNENLVGLLLTLIFVLIIAIVVMQIMHTRKVYKIIKTMMKHIAELHTKH